MPAPGFFAHPTRGLAVMDHTLAILEWQQALRIVNYFYVKQLLSTKEFNLAYGLLTGPSESKQEEAGIKLTGKFIQKYPEEFYTLAVKQKLIGGWSFSQRFMDYAIRP